MKLSRRQRRFLELALKVSELSEMPQQHGAVLEKNGNVLALGANRSRNNPVFVTTIEKSEYSYHAEIQALKRHRGSAEGATLYVARTGKLGNPADSKPCRSCQQTLDAAGIKRVIYTRTSTIGHLLHGVI